MAIIGIIAIAQNFAIGKNGKLPWHYSSDLKFFKQTTTGNTVLMGFNTWRSIGEKPLPNRLNIVLSRSNSIENQPSVLLLRDKYEALALSKYLKGELFIIGGAQVYKSFSDVIEKWVVTEIPLTIEDADAFMPPDFLSDFEVGETKRLEADDLTVKIYSRARQPEN